MIYVPELNDYKCYVVINNDTIRAYKEKPYNPGYNNSLNIQYRDYFINASYLYQDGTQSFNNYTTIPTCLSNDVLTDRYMYRLDIDKILVTFFILLFIFYFIISRVVNAFLKGF